MGYYINETNTGRPLGYYKANDLIADGAKKIPQPDNFQENLVCVVNNGMFEAAGYCYSEAEFKEFSDSNDSRPKTWLIVPNAAKLSGYLK